MHINEKKIDITLNLKSEDPKLNDIYNLIKSKILNAPEKYDDIIKNKRKIVNTVAWGSGLIFGLILSTLLLFVPTINRVLLKGYVIYPIITLLLGYLIGNIIASLKLEQYFEPISPEKKYYGYDSSNYQKIYKDDIDSFIGTSDILIGKKIINLEYRKIIKKEYQKYKSFIPIEIIFLIIATIAVVVVGFYI